MNIVGLIVSTIVAIALVSIGWRATFLPKIARILIISAGILIAVTLIAGLVIKAPSHLGATRSVKVLALAMPNNEANLITLVLWMIACAIGGILLGSQWLMPVWLLRAPAKISDGVTKYPFAWRFFRISGNILTGIICATAISFHDPAKFGNNFWLGIIFAVFFAIGKMWFHFWVNKEE